MAWLSFGEFTARGKLELTDFRTKMKKYKVLGDLGNVIQALDEIDQDKLLKTGVNEIINIHMKILKNQQRELKNLTKELKKEVKSPNKKVIL